jgi:hypothetical protein
MQENISTDLDVVRFFLMLWGETICNDGGGVSHLTEQAELPFQGVIKLGVSTRE